MFNNIEDLKRRDLNLGCFQSPVILYSTVKFCTDGSWIDGGGGGMTAPDMMLSSQITRKM